MSFYSNVDEEEQGPGFRFFGLRKRTAMKDCLAWVRENPLPTLEDVRSRFRGGPGNLEDVIHPFCTFHQCVDEECTGIH